MLFESWGLCICGLALCGVCPFRLDAMTMNTSQSVCTDRYTAEFLSVNIWNWHHKETHFWSRLKLYLRCTSFFRINPPFVVLLYLFFTFFSPLFSPLCNHNNVSSGCCCFLLPLGSKPQSAQSPDPLLPSPISKSPVFRTGSEPVLSPSMPRRSAELLAGQEASKVKPSITQV